MARSIRDQNLVIVTLARRTNVEVHCIREGMLVKKMLVDQKSIPRSVLREMLEEAFSSRQVELFQGAREDINEMRIIASWCLTRRDESTVIETDRHNGLTALLRAVVDAVRKTGGSRDTDTGA
jgi:hypothetical protein